MRTHRPHPGPPHWLRLPRRTARLRLTVLYGGAVFLACGATVLAFTYLLYGLLGHPAHLVLLIHKRGREVPIAAPSAEATIHVAGLGQIALNRQQLPIVSGIALAHAFVDGNKRTAIMAGEMSSASTLSANSATPTVTSPVPHPRSRMVGVGHPASLRRTPNVWSRRARRSFCCNRI